MISFQAGNYLDNVKYCGYCEYHYQRINKRAVKTIPAFRPIPSDQVSPITSPEKAVHSNHTAAKDGPKPLLNSSSSTSSSSSSSKNKGKRGRKVGSMLYDAKLEPPKFNPDLASLNSSNNCIVTTTAAASVSAASVTLTPVPTTLSGGGGANNTDKGDRFFATSSDSSSKTDRIFANSSDLKAREEKKTPNVVVKIGKHGETYHAKKDENDRENNSSSSNNNSGGGSREVTLTKDKDPSPAVSEAVLSRVPNNLSKSEKQATEKPLLSGAAATLVLKEEAAEKKGFTTANFTETFVTQSVSVTAALIKSDSEKSPSRGKNSVDTTTTTVKVECMDVDSTVSLSSKITSSSSVSAKSHPHAPPPGPLQAGQESHPAMRDFFGPPPPPPPTSRTAGEAPPITTANCSSESLPHVKNDTREKSGSSSSSSSSTSSSSSLSSSFSFESSNQIKPSSSSSATSMMARANLSSSVSLFPTNSTTPANHRPPAGEPLSLSSVSITPAVAITSAPFPSSLTVTRTDGSSPSSLRISSVTQPVTISPIVSTEEKRGSGEDDRSPSLDSPNKSSAGSPRLSLKTGSNAAATAAKRLGRPPKKGTHIATNSLGSTIFSPEPDPDEGPSGKRFRPDEKTEGGEELHRLMMFGATLNPSSGMAREMTNVLQVSLLSIYFSTVLRNEFADPRA